MALRKRDVEVGAYYLVRLSGRFTVVRIDTVDGGPRTGYRTGWTATNMRTGRTVTIRSAAKLRRPVSYDHAMDVRKGRA